LREYYTTTCKKKLCLKHPFNEMDSESFAGERNTRRTKKRSRKLRLRDQTMLKEERDRKTLTGSDRQLVSASGPVPLQNQVGLL
jgi:hypothetical protein